MLALATSATADFDQGSEGGVTYRTDNGDTDPATIKVRCPGKMHALSGGFAGGYNGAVPSELFPYDGPDRCNSLGASGPTTVIGYLICG